MGNLGDIGRLALFKGIVLIVQITAVVFAQYGPPEHIPGAPVTSVSLQNAPQRKNSVKFLLYFNPNNTESCHSIESGNKESLLASSYNASQPLKILIHAALANSQTQDDVKVIKDAYLKNCVEANVIMVDYGPMTMSNVPPLLAPLNFFQGIVSLLRTNQIAQEVAEFVQFLTKCQVLPGPQEVHLLGFGLGAHVAGTVGRILWRSEGHKVGRVTGLDPLVMVKLPFKPFRIDPTDADFVDVTNTALRKFTFRRRGHVRFYVNGGGPHQPNCPRFFTSSTGCSHHSSIFAFAKSIDKPKAIVGCRCLSIFCRSQFLNSRSCVDPIVYGEYASKSSRGSYYVTLT